MYVLFHQSPRCATTANHFSSITNLGSWFNFTGTLVMINHIPTLAIGRNGSIIIISRLAPQKR
uniref:Uncharacterized protein n=1 Tax=Picea glauca TaxID=3330 RepID=A0A117NIW0_PICGL|nr:hypothetical protein ABT39_MTgene371 [Picea glauca]QHR86496.1 hypothetical protein Q903MT_gene498 [Picea sitchensis]